VKFEDSKDKNYYYFDNIPSSDDEYTVHLWREPYVVWMYDAPGDVQFDIYGMPKDDRTIAVKSDDSIVRTISVSKDTGEITLP